jgi:arylsulfatase
MSSQPPEPRRKPNVLLIVLDDMGYSDLGCFGSEIETPTLDTLAYDGVRFTQFYATARCWPTRSCLLTGYYAQQVAMDPPDQKTFYRPDWVRLLPHHLAPLGYRNYHSGKWHIGNVLDPVQDGGFDISWGYKIPEFHHFFDTDAGPTFSSTAITDHALACLKDHQAHHADAPFFHYLCYTAPHFPVQAEQADIQKYLDRYDRGWDQMRQERYERQRQMGIVNTDISPRDPTLGAPWFTEAFGQRFGPGEVAHAVAWDSLTDEQKRFQATKMAIHAAMIDRTDREIARVLDQVRAMNAFDDTLVLLLSDNGASAEIMIRGNGHDPADAPGSARTHLCLGPGWATCSNTPFRRHKIWVNEGGISTPLIAHWPNGINQIGGLRHTPGHVIDILPTILDVTGASALPSPLPAHAPALPGKSLVPAFGTDVTIERSHIYFRHSENRALRVGDYKIVSGTSSSPVGSADDAWGLFALSVDRAENVDLATVQPMRVREMVRIWEKCDAAYSQNRNIN